MFIRVKYGDDETLLCNPNCTIINLLASIKTRSKQADSETVVDLSDETGFFFARQTSLISQIVNHTQSKQIYVYGVASDFYSIGFSKII